MSKRFTETEKWNRPWFRKLPIHYKLLWCYICDNCDIAGIWYVDLELASFQIGAQFDQQDTLSVLEKQIEVLNCGSKWYIKDFVQFQYGELVPNNNLHRSVIKKQEQMRGCPGADQGQGRGMAGDKVKVKVKVKEKPNNIIVEEKNAEISNHLKIDLFDKTFKDFIQMRKEKKKPASEKARQMILKKLDTYTVEIAIKMLENSIVNSWSDVYPLKEQATGQTAQDYDRTIEIRLGKIATEDMIMKLMCEMPQPLWWKIEKYLQRRYPGSKGISHLEAKFKRNQENLSNMLGGILK